MTPGLRIFLLVLVACVTALAVGVDSATRAQESYKCSSGKESCYQSGYAGLTQEQEHGRDTWYFWTGGDLDSSGKQSATRRYGAFSRFSRTGRSICCRRLTPDIVDSDSSYLG